MAKLYKYVPPRKGYYIKHSFRQGEVVRHVTYQLHSEADVLIRMLRLRDGSSIERNFLNFLRDAELVYTGGSGAGESSVIGHEEINRKRRRQDIDKYLKLHSFKESDEGINDSETVYEYDLSNIRLPSKPWVIEPKEDMPPFEKNILKWETIPHEALRLFFVMAKPGEEFAYMKKVWKFFELSERATYSTNTEYNNVLARLMALAKILNMVYESTYGGNYTFNAELLELWGDGLPLIRAELYDRFDVDGENFDYWPYEPLVESVYSDVVTALDDYYDDRLGDKRLELSFDLILDLRQAFTRGNDIDAHYSNDPLYRETGFTPEEMDAVPFLYNEVLR